jgi:hypothetical protein
MKKCRVVAVAVILLSLSSFGQSRDTRLLLDSAKIYLVNQLYARTDNSLERILHADPDNAEAAYLLLASAQTKILDYESYEMDADYFVEKAKATLDVLSKSLPGRRGRDSLECLFYIGNIEGGISIIEAKVGNWPAAVKSGASSIGAFKRVIKTTPDYYPAYLGLGIFNYYISQNLKWLPFFEDKRDEGLEQVRLSTKAEFPYSYVAKNSLCWILLERNEYRSADSIAGSVLAELPANTIFIRLKARIALFRKDLPSAAAWARKLVAISEKRVPANWSDLFSGYQILISTSDELGRKNECLALCRKALAKNVPEPYLRIPYVKKHLRYIADIQRKYAN